MEKKIPINEVPEVVGMDSSHDEVFAEVHYHYSKGVQDMEQRKLRKNGWDQIIKAYYSKLPDNWAYLSKVTDPVIRTALIEKSSRLFNGKLRGTVVPRENGDIIKAKIINTILDFQWDSASYGGSMLEKWALMDQYCRMFGASFALNYWVKTDTYEGCEFKVLDNRDVFVDYQATHIKNANWVIIREWVTLQDLKKEVNGISLYENLDVLEARILEESASAKRNTAYVSMVKQLRGLEDRVGDDAYYKKIEIATEYSKDRWRTIAPKYGLVLRDIENPLKGKFIPITMLRYYQNGDDVYGESEVEAVLPLQRVINATLCGFVDQVNFSLRPPIKVANNADGVRLETIQFAPNALWLTGSSPNNVLEFQSGTQIVQQFSAVYQVLKSAFNTALGETSAGVSQFSPLQTEKTATEVRATYAQMQSRDEFNQMYLKESLKEQMMQWILLNQQFLFDDPTKYHIVFKITGMDALNELKRYSLDDMEIPDEVTNGLVDFIENNPNAMDQSMLQTIIDEVAIPAYPENMKPSSKTGEFVPKMEFDKYGEFAVLRVNKDDLIGTYDYIPDVKSMAVGVSDQQVNGRNQALQILLNPNVNAQLAQEGDKIKLKDLIIQVLEDNGVRNASKLFETNAGTGQQLQPNIAGTGNTQPSIPNLGAEAPQGLPTATELFAGADTGVSRPL
jgi:hypothetical protein